MDNRVLLGGGSTWDPMRLGQPLVWLDATQGISRAGSFVDQWVDRSGHGWVFQQTVAGARPTYSATAWNTSRPGVVFGGAGYTDLRSTSGAPAQFVNECTIAATIKISVSASRQFILITDDGGTARFGWGANSSNNELLDLHAGGADITGSTITGGAKRLWLTRSVATSSDTSFINGVPSISSSDGTDALPEVRLTIGGQSLIGTSYMSATLVELIIWPYPVSSSADALYRAYSQAKWG